MIQITDLKKKFHAEQDWISNGLSLTIPAGEMTCIIGQSGEGKSILLKQIIGLIKPTSGSITIDGEEVTSMSEKELQKLFCKCGYVFQDAALLDSLTVLENIGISLFENGKKMDEVLPIIKKKLALVNLNESILDNYPSELSGGMRKRVGLARTLISEPQILLYDEPTTGLDPITTRIVFELMTSMQQQLGCTSIVISHNTSIFDYADNIALLYQGKIQYFGKAENVWKADNPYIQQFIHGHIAGPIKTKIDSTT